MSVNVEIKLSTIYPQQEAKQTKKNKASNIVYPTNIFSNSKVLHCVFKKRYEKRLILSSSQSWTHFRGLFIDQSQLFFNYSDNLPWKQYWGPGTLQTTESGVEQRANYLLAPTMGRQTIVHKQCFLKEGMDKSGGVV